MMLAFGLGIATFYEVEITVIILSLTFFLCGVLRFQDEFSV